MDAGKLREVNSDGLKRVNVKEEDIFCIYNAGYIKGRKGSYVHRT